MSDIYRPQVVTCGEAMIAFIASQGTPAAVAQTFTRSVAGSESNVAIGLARLGHAVAFVGRVGNDPEGQAVVRALRADGVDVRHLKVDPEAPTGILIRDHVTDRPVQVSYRRAGSAGSRLQPGDLPGIRTEVVHITGLTAALSAGARESVRALAQAGRAHNAHVVLDPNIRLRLAPAGEWREIMAELIGYADDILVGSDELEILNLDLEELGRRVPGAVVVKHGRAGSTAYFGGEVVQMAAREVRAVDPVGAGDAYAAGWISAFLDGADLAGRMTRATLVASCVVAHGDDTTGYPDRKTLDQLLASGVDVIR